MKNKLTDLCGNSLLQNDFKNTLCEIRLGAQIASADLRVYDPFFCDGANNMHSGSMKFATHLNHISHLETSSGTNWSNRWTYRAFVINARPDQIAPADLRVYDLYFCDGTVVTHFKELGFI